MKKHQWYNAKCIFCNISRNLYTNNMNNSKNVMFITKYFFIIRDIQPKYKKHFLIIVKPHVNILNNDTSQSIINNFWYRQKLFFLFLRIIYYLPQIINILGLQTGFKIIINNIFEQQIQHLHLHLVTNY